MASQMDPGENRIDDHEASRDGDADPIDEHLLSALETREDDATRYHLREALQLQIAELQGT